MAAMYDVTKQTISQHINRIYADGELTPEATVKKYLTVQTEGKRQVSRSQDHYNLQMIIAVGFKVNNQRAVQFRKWAGRIVKDHTIQTLWNYINHKYAYTVEFDSAELIQKSIAHINEKLFVSELQYTTTIGRQKSQMNEHEISRGDSFVKKAQELPGPFFLVY